MGSMLRPGAIGLNGFMLDKEAKLKAFLSSLLEGMTPTGYNEENSMPMGPEAPPPNLLRGATGISARPGFQPDSGYGAPSRGAFGLDQFAPLLAAAVTGRTPDEPAQPSSGNPLSMLANLFGGGEPEALPAMAPPQRTAAPPRGLNKIFLDKEAGLRDSFTGGELPEVHNPAMSAMTGGLPPEILALSESLAKSGGSLPNPASASRSASGPPNLPPTARPAAPALMTRANPVAGPINEPRVIEPFDMPEAPMDLSSMLNTSSNLVGASREPFVPEPYDGPADDLDPAGPRLASEEILGEDPFKSPATDDYLNTLRARPRHDDHEGSKGRRILSGVFKGLFGADWGIGDAPHQKALRKWSDEGSGKKEAATFEQSGLKEKRLRLKDVMAQQQKKQEYELKVQQELNRFKQFEANLGFKMDKAERDRLVDIEKNATMARIAEWRKDYQTQRLNLDQQRVGLESQRVDISRTRANNSGDRALDPRVQEGIEKEARRIVRNDPRYSKWYLPESDEFNDIPMRRSDGRIKRDRQGNVVVKEAMDPATRELLQREIIKAREIVANRKRSSYSRAGFSSPFADMSEGEDLDFGEVFNDH